MKEEQAAPTMSKYEYNKQRKRDFSLAKGSPKKKTIKVDKEPEAKIEGISLEALSAKQEQVICLQAIRSSLHFLS